MMKLLTARLSETTTLTKIIALMVSIVVSRCDKHTDQTGSMDSLSSLDLFYKHSQHMTCGEEQKDTPHSKFFTTERLCLLMKSTETFTDGTENVLVMTTQHKNEIIEDLRNCTFELKNSPLVWQLPKNLSKMVDVSTEVQLIKYKKVKNIILYLTFKETASLLIAAASCKSCNEYFVFTWFILYHKLLFSVVTSPENTVTVQRPQDILQTRYGDCNANLSSQDIPANEEQPFSFYLRDGMKWEAYGKLTKNGKIELFANHAYTLRNYPENGKNKKGVPFARVVTIIEDPYVIIHEYSDSMYDTERRTCEVGQVCWKYEVSNDSKIMKAYCCIGYLMELWSYIERDLGINSLIYIVEDDLYGDIKNGEWVGLIGDLVDDKADVIVASLNLNYKRMEVVDFSWPFLVGGLALVSKVNEETLPFLNFKPFEALTRHLWALTFCVTIFGAILVFIAAKMRKLRNCNNWQQILFYFIGFFFQKDLGGKVPFNLSTAIISITVALFTYLIMSTYTAVLTANYVSNTESLVIKDYKDAKITNPTNEYKYGTLANSAYSQLFRNSNDPVWNRMYNFMKDYSFTDTNEAFKKLENGELAGVIQDYFIAYHYIAKDDKCKLKYAGDPIPDSGGSFAFQKDSKLFPVITDQLIKYQETNLLEKWREPWFVNKCIGVADTSVSSAGIEYFGGMSIILAGTAALCFCLFLVEIIIFDYAKKNKNQPVD